MTKKLVNILSIALIYCGAVFGAGFASGREIFSFFSCYKGWGIVASAVTGFLFIFFGAFVCRYAKIQNIKNTEKFLKLIFPKYIAVFFTFIANIFLMLSFCIMITGCGAVFLEQFGISSVFGSLLTLGICFIVIKNKVSGLEKFNFFATPFMFLGVVVLCAMCFGLTKTSDVVFHEFMKPIISGLLYISYNMVSAVAVLISSAKIAKTPTEAALGGGLGGVLISVPLVMMSCVLALHDSVARFSLPFFTLIYNNFPKMSLGCSVVLYLAMVTTAVSSGIGVLENISPKKSGKSALILCILAFLISFIPFSELVLSVYSAFGIVGVFLVGGIFALLFKNKRKKNKTREKWRK